VRRPSSPLAACGVILVAIAVGALAARHRVAHPAETPVALPRAETPMPVGPLDLNRATARELEALPRIGPSLAERIIAARHRQGGFRSVDELDGVRGIGRSTLEAIRPLVTVGPPPEQPPP
jgi:competence protein ComEA